MPQRLSDLETLPVRRLGAARVWRKLALSLMGSVFLSQTLLSQALAQNPAPIPYQPSTPASQTPAPTAPAATTPAPQTQATPTSATASPPPSSPQPASPLPASPTVVPAALPDPSEPALATDPDAADKASQDETPMGHPYVPGGLSDADASTLTSALNAVKSRNFSYAESLRSSLNDPLARKLVLWSIINNDGEGIYGFAALDGARRDLWGWPRETKRQVAAERSISTSGLTPAQTIEWFNGTPPETTEGAMALIRSFEATGATTEATKLARSWWSSEVFDFGDQERFYAAFGQYLTAQDHKARLDLLLIGPQGAAATRMLDFVDPGYRKVGEAAMALRAERSGASDLYNAAMAANPHNAVLAFEGAKFLRRHGLDSLAYPLLADFPQAPDNDAIAASLWSERLGYYRSALKARDFVAAYHSMNKAGFAKGEKMAEAEFFAGFVALSRLHRPQEALEHFKLVKTAGTSPITQGRANYWIGRAYEMLEQPDEALAAYQEGGQYIYAFYGQLAAEKAGHKSLILGKDPEPSPEDRTRFENRDMVKAARMLGNIGNRELFRAMVIAIANTLPNAEEEALLYDMAKSYDSQDIASRAARISQQRGFYLPERAYPLRSIPPGRGPEPAMVLAITRQESGFDPGVRSHANARGMMQIVPSTGRVLARRLSVGYSDNKLFEAEYNMTLGAYYLAEMVDRFGGSYIMAAAGYNAGPGRPASWVQIYADPRGDDGDPFSFIESAPFSETRDYMMRVTENLRVYRARLNGGVAPLTAMADVKRGTVVADVDDSDLQATSGPISYLQYQKSGPMDPAPGAAAPGVDGNIQTRLLSEAAPAPQPATPPRPAPVPIDVNASGIVLPSMSLVKAKYPAKVACHGKSKRCAAAKKAKGSKAAKSTRHAKATTSKKKRK